MDGTILWKRSVKLALGMLIIPLFNVFRNTIEIELAIELQFFIRQLWNRRHSEALDLRQLDY